MLLGIDVGTGGTRAVLIDRAGKVLASFASEHAPIHSEHIGWAEQDPEDWWRAAREAIAGAMAASELTGAEIEAVGLTGQMHGCVMLDADGKVLRPALIWCDQRTQPQCDWLTEKIGFERLIELTCNPALPNFTLTKLLWVRDHQPEIFAKIAHVLCPKDYVRYRLTGEFAMDMQEASGTLLLDVTHRRWSAEVAEAAGIPMSGCRGSLKGRRFARGSARRGLGRRGWRRGLRLRLARVIRARGQWGWGYSRRVRFRRRSGRAGLCLPRQIRPSKTGWDGCILLSCGAGAMARDGRDEWSGAELSLFSRYVCAGDEL